MWLGHAPKEKLGFSEVALVPTFFGDIGSIKVTAVALHQNLHKCYTTDIDSPWLQLATQQQSWLQLTSTDQQSKTTQLRAGLRMDIEQCLSTTL